MKKIVILSVLFLLILSSNSYASYPDPLTIQDNISKVLIKNDEIPYLKLFSSRILNTTWPNISQLPSYMQNPENTPINAKINVQLADTIKYQADRLNGYEQIFQYDQFSQNNSIFVSKNKITVQYGYFDSFNDARNSLWYIVFNKGARRIPVGDLGYLMPFPNNAGGCTYFIDGKYLFMVDADRQSVEDEIINVLLSKTSKLKK